jgi:hypothetical protein
MGCALALLAASPLLLSGCGGADAQTVSFTLSSPDIAANSTIGNKFVLNGLGCSGQNIAPALIWTNVPAGTQSFSVTLYDPDAPTGSGFWHLSLHDIPRTATGLAQGAANSQATLPAGAYTAISDYHDTGLTGENDKWGGPCPPAGDAPHRYVFTVYALDVPNLPAAAQIPPTGTAALHGFALNKGLGAHVLAKASFTATYGH